MNFFLLLLYTSLNLLSTLAFGKGLLLTCILLAISLYFLLEAWEYYSLLIHRAPLVLQLLIERNHLR